MQLLEFFQRLQGYEIYDDWLRKEMSTPQDFFDYEEGRIAAWKGAEVSSLREFGSLTSTFWVYEFIEDQDAELRRMLVRSALSIDGIAFAESIDATEMSTRLEATLDQVETDWQREVALGLICCWCLNRPPGKVVFDKMEGFQHLFTFCWNKAGQGELSYLSAVVAIGLSTRFDPQSEPTMDAAQRIALKQLQHSPFTELPRAKRAEDHLLMLRKMMGEHLPSDTSVLSL